MLRVPKTYPFERLLSKMKPPDGGTRRPPYSEFGSGDGMGFEDSQTPACTGKDFGARIVVCRLTIVFCWLWCIPSLVHITNLV